MRAAIAIDPPPRQDRDAAAPRSARADRRGDERLARRVFVFVGLALILVSALWLALSHQPVNGDIQGVSPIVWLVAVGMAGGAVYMGLPWALGRLRGSAGMLAAAIAVGAVMRLLLLPSVPMLENDYNRYLWDGAVVSLGFNPYKHAPADVRRGAGMPAPLTALAEGSEGVIDNIGHAEVGTIYPPLAQGVFALAHRLGPWDLTVWRLVLLLFDAATLAVLIAILRQLGRSPLWAAVYWWNPLIAKEFFNSAHMDAILIPFLLGALLLTLRGRAVWGSGVLALAAGVKVWPILLLPAILRPLLGNARSLVAAGLVFLLGLALMAIPMALTGLDDKSGLVAYAITWEKNDSLFRAIAWLIDQALVAADAISYDAHRIARSLVAVALIGLAIGVNRRRPETSLELTRRWVIVIAALFLLSPTQYPWYYAWLVPFLALVPSYALLLLTATLPLYYLRFYFEDLGLTDVFDGGIVWLEYLPILCLGFWEFVLRRGPAPRARPIAAMSGGILR